MIEAGTEVGHDPEQQRRHRGDRRRWRRAVADEIADRGGLDKTEPYTTVHSDKNIDGEAGG